ncbi:potassium channel family protein [Halococcoides cellulosivorans]|uniref:Metal transporter n=1 Tax=Halococcoides cellulosivorans TaxID=1679096 RepID=A0A2R4X2D3_9EURY|nr:NAD-binding protein [Halococcoides cellulosivorans]AWB27934.1 metal transporter [Halococcoides cellulosivorans]
MDRRRQVVLYGLALLALLALASVGYKVAMAVFEGQSRSIWEALVVVVQTFTTTGYGEDAASWESPGMLIFMVVMMVIGVVAVFMALPVIVVPWIEDSLSTTVPRSVEVHDHVIVCSDSVRGDLLVPELHGQDVETVLIEADLERAQDRLAAGQRVIAGDPEDPDVLDAANVRSARGVVLDLGAEADASIALAVQQALNGRETPVYAFAEDPDLAEYYRLAGVDEVYYPRQLVAESLAHKVTAALDIDVDDDVEIADDFELTEVPVQPDSALDGVRVVDSQIRERTGAQVVGAWFEGAFEIPPDNDARIDARTVLLVAGNETQVSAVRDLARAERRHRRGGSVVVCGLGSVGSTVVTCLTSAGLDCTTIDRDAGSGVDVVGDAADPDTFERIDLSDVRSVVVAVPDDTDSIFTTLVVRELAPTVEIVARANDPENVQKLYRAGADYVLAVSTVSSRMVAESLLGEEPMAYDRGFGIQRVAVGRLAGETIAALDVRSRTGCSIVAIDRDEQMLTEIDPETTLRAGDVAIVVGSDAGIETFIDLAGV